MKIGEYTEKYGEKRQNVYRWVREGKLKAKMAETVVKRLDIEDKKIGGEIIPNRRSLRQNKALHKYFELLAEELNDAGLDMRAVLKEEVAIPWNKNTVKDYLWRSIQRLQLSKESTAELTTAEIDKVFETLNRHVGERFGIHVPFPSEDRLGHSGQRENIGDKPTHSLSSVRGPEIVEKINKKIK